MKLGLFLPRKIAAIMGFAAIFASLAILFQHREYLALEWSTARLDNGHLVSLSPFYDYLSKVGNDPGKLLLRTEIAWEWLIRNGGEHSIHDVLTLLDESTLEQVCDSSVVKASSGALARHCEKRSASGDPDSGIVFCASLRFEENRKECRKNNDSKFSTESDDHCSTAACIVDNAVFHSYANGSAPCQNVHPSLAKDCLEIAKRYEEYREDPSKYVEDALENALLGKTPDPVWLAARSGVLEYPDSPSFACRNLSEADAKTCETRMKELFSYVQKRGLKNRLERID